MWYLVLYCAVLLTVATTSFELALRNIYRGEDSLKFRLLCVVFGLLVAAGLFALAGYITSDWSRYGGLLVACMMVVFIYAQVVFHIRAMGGFLSLCLSVFLLMLIAATEGLAWLSVQDLPFVAAVVVSLGIGGVSYLLIETHKWTLAELEIELSDEDDDLLHGMSEVDVSDTPPGKLTIWHKILIGFFLILLALPAYDYLASRGERP